MKHSTKILLFWIPRLITIFFAVFLSIFAADIFSEGYGILGTLLALFVHLIPSILILTILFLSWKREWIGGILYIMLSVLYIISKWNKFEIDVFFLITAPLLLAGIMFLIGWFRRKEIRNR